MWCRLPLDLSGAPRRPAIRMLPGLLSHRKELAWDWWENSGSAPTGSDPAWRRCTSRPMMPDTMPVLGAEAVILRPFGGVWGTEIGPAARRRFRPRRSRGIDLLSGYSSEGGRAGRGCTGVVNDESIIARRRPKHGAWRSQHGLRGFHPRFSGCRRASYGRKKVPMELLLVIIILILLFGGGFSFYRR